MTAAQPKAQALRAKLDVRKPAIAMAAHNPLAAKVAANAGFDAIWGSGFELSASYAVPDANILPMGTHLEMMRAIGEVQEAPVIADIDTGFGNAVNVAYAVPRYLAAGVAAIVMEDKTFPKDSSLRAAGRQELVSVTEFQGKLGAAKSAGRGVLVVARTEALIAGLGQEEALRRGAAYAEAGADAVLIHSKQKTPDEILSFCRAWSGRGAPLLLPPTHPPVSFPAFPGAGQGAPVFFGNHAIRAAVAAMTTTFRRIIAEGGIAGVEREIASVADVFALQGDAHMREIEKTYLR